MKAATEKAKGAPAWAPLKLHDEHDYDGTFYRVALHDSSAPSFMERRKMQYSYELERVRSALAYIEPRDHDTWWRIGMGLKAEYGDDAWPIYEEWSRQSDNYDARENRRRWDSFRRGGGITIATVFAMARANGWRDDGTYRLPEPQELARRQRAKIEAGAREKRDTAACEAADKARAIWSIATSATADNPYCQRKGIVPTETVREIDVEKARAVLGVWPSAKGRRLQGRCIVMLIKASGKPVGLQLIDGGGRKYFIAGSVIGGGYWATKPLPDSDGEFAVLVGEGVATVLSATQAIPNALGVAALSNFNIPRVSRQLRESYPRADLVILADIDKKTGEPDKHATEAAKSVGGRLAVPQFDAQPASDRKDFNDMMRLHGADALRQVIKSAEEPQRQLSAGTDWPELVPLDNGELPRLSAATLGGWLGEFADALAQATEVPLELTGAMCLGAVSTAAARRLRLRVKEDYFEPLNIWTLAALTPGNRKSAAERAAAEPLREWEREQAAAVEPQIEEATAAAKIAAARAKELRREAAKTKDDAKADELARKALEVERGAPIVPKVPQLWTSDATPENLGVLLADNGERMAWISAEAGFFEIVGGRYANGVPNLDLMLKAHSGDPERVDRLGRPPVFLSHPLLTVAMSPQPDLLRGLMEKPGFRGRGLLGRFMYFLPPSPLGSRTFDGAPVPESIRRAYRENLRAMLNWPLALGDRLHLLQLSSSARDIFHQFALAVETQMRPGEPFEHATDWAGKAPGAAARIAGVLHAAEHAEGCPWGQEIPAGTMERAADFVAVSGQHTLATFRLMAANKELSAAGRLWEWIERRSQSEFTARDAWQGLKGAGPFARMADITAAVTVLEERGYLRTRPPGTKRRPGRPGSPLFVVRPEIARRWPR
jgi:phage/plasmid primase-like uncharacterized protein